MNLNVPEELLGIDHEKKKEPSILLLACIAVKTLQQLFWYLVDSSQINQFKDKAIHFTWTLGSVMVLVIRLYIPFQYKASILCTQISQCIQIKPVCIHRIPLRLQTSWMALSGANLHNHPQLIDSTDHCWSDQYGFGTVSKDFAAPTATLYTYKYNLQDAHTRRSLTDIYGWRLEFNIFSRKVKWLYPVGVHIIMYQFTEHAECGSNMPCASPVSLVTINKDS